MSMFISKSRCCLLRCLLPLSSVVIIRNVPLTIQRRAKRFSYNSYHICCIPDTASFPFLPISISYYQKAKFFRILKIMCYYIPGFSVSIIFNLGTKRYINFYLKQKAIIFGTDSTIRTNKVGSISVYTI